MSFEKILYKLRDAWRQDIRQSLGGLPGYYWGTVVSVAPLQVFLDVQDPAEDPRPASDTVGGLRPEERVLLVLLDGSFSVVGVAGRENVSGVARFATVGARDAAFPEPEDGLICYVTGNGYYVRENGAWARWAADTVTVPLAAPFAGNACTVTRDMSTGLATIAFTSLSGTPVDGTQSGIGTIPACYRPDGTQKFFIGSSNPTNSFGRWMSITTSGEINIIASGTMFGATGTGGSGLFGSHTYRLATD